LDGRPVRLDARQEERRVLMTLGDGLKVPAGATLQFRLKCQS